MIHKIYHVKQGIKCFILKQNISKIVIFVGAHRQNVRKSVGKQLSYSEDITPAH